MAKGFLFQTISDSFFLLNSFSLLFKLKKKISKCCFDIFLTYSLWVSGNVTAWKSRTNENWKTNGRERRAKVQRSPNVYFHRSQQLQKTSSVQNVAFAQSFQSASPRLPVDFKQPRGRALGACKTRAVNVTRDVQVAARGRATWGGPEMASCRQQRTRRRWAGVCLLLFHPLLGVLFCFGGRRVGRVVGEECWFF